MDLERDKFFFHYTTSDAAFGHILPDKRLRFSRYRDMRDPLENKDWWFAAGGFGGATEDEEAQQAAGFFEFNRAANAIRRSSLLSSLTIDTPPGGSEEEDPFFRGWARGRMWEQYAENNAGVCLVFDREKLVEAVVTSLREQSLAPPYCQEVTYHGSGVWKPVLNLQELGQDVTSERVAEYIEANYEALFFHKVLDWESEHEYRFCTISNDNHEVFADIGDALHAVVAGESFPVWQRPAAIEACTVAGALPLRTDWSGGQPRLAHLRPRRTRRDTIRETLENNPHPGPPAAPPAPTEP